MALNNGGGGGGAGATGIRAGRAFVEFFADGSGMVRDLARLKAKCAAFAATTVNIGAKMFGSGAALALPIRSAVMAFADFDDNMRAFKAAITGTDAEFARLTDRAKELGRTSSYTAAQVSALMIELGRAGFTADQVDVMTASVLNLARATGTDATLSASILGNTIAQFGLKGEDAARVADVLTAGANLSANSVQDLGQALEYTGKVAADNNLSLEDTVAILGALGNVGIRGTNAGTATKLLLTKTAAESKGLFDTFGVQALDAAGNVRPLVDVLDDVQKSVAGMGNGQKAQKFNEFFGLLGITSASVISSSAKSVRELREQIGAAGGIAAKTAVEMDGGLGGSLRRMRGAAEGAVIALGEGMAPTIGTVAGGLQLAAGAAAAWVAANPVMAQNAVGVTAALLGTGAALIGLGVAGKVAATGLFVPLAAVKALGAALALVSSSPLLIGGALAALWVTQTESGRAFAADVGKSLGGIADEAVASAGRMKDIFVDSWSGITAAIEGGDLAGAGKVAFAGLEAVWAESLSTMTKAWVGFKGTTLGQWVAETVGAVKELHAIATKEDPNRPPPGEPGGAPPGTTRFLGLDWEKPTIGSFADAFKRAGVEAKALFSGGSKGNASYDDMRRTGIEGIERSREAETKRAADEGKAQVAAAEADAKAASEKLERIAAEQEMKTAGKALGDLLAKTADAAGAEAVKDAAKLQAALGPGFWERTGGEAAKRLKPPTEAQVMDAVKGGTGGAFARQQFGYGDKVDQKQLEAALRTAKAAEGTDKKLEKLDKLPDAIAGELLRVITLS